MELFTTMSIPLDLYCVASNEKQMLSFQITDVMKRSGFSLLTMLSLHRVNTLCNVAAMFFVESAMLTRRES